MAKKLTKQEVEKGAKQLYNLTLVSKNYINNRSPLLWMSPSGATFYRSWSDLNSKKVITTTNRNSYESSKQQIESYKNLGYKLAMTKSEYDKASRTKGNNIIFKITHDELPGTWCVTMYRFKQAALNKLMGINISSGEYLIGSILHGNDIKFYSEYQVNIKGKNHRFDFYLPDKNIFIEYDGIQHFSPIVYWGGEDALSKRKKRDEEKNNYVNRVGGTLIRIGYKNDTQDKIIKEINNQSVMELSSVKYKLPNSKSTIAEYYKYNSLEQTEKKFNISKVTIIKIFKDVYGGTKTEENNPERDIVDYYENHTVRETIAKYKVSRSWIMRHYRKLKGIPKRGVIND